MLAFVAHSVFLPSSTGLDSQKHSLEISILILFFRVVTEKVVSETLPKCAQPHTGSSFHSFSELFAVRNIYCLYFSQQCGNEIRKSADREVPSSQEMYHKLLKRLDARVFLELNSNKSNQNPVSRIHFASFFILQPNPVLSAHLTMHVHQM